MGFIIAVIYLAFISLGLPDSLLGSGWPVMHIEFGAPISWASIITSLIFFSTIISALCSDFLITKLGTGKVVAASVFLTAAAMLGFSLSGSFALLCVLSIPYGFGAGAIDACLNNYVALHLSSRHMNWLHCFWGVGATVSPYIMSAALASRWGWQGGYRAVSFIQFALFAVMLAAIPRWNRVKTLDGGEEDESVRLPLTKVIRLPGAVHLFIAFIMYCSIEQLPIVWASSYYVERFSLDAKLAASLGSLFYFGMMTARAICGIFANRLSDKLLIRYGSVIALLSSLLILLPVKSYVPSIIGFVALGFGCAPVYPSLVHSTPFNFGKKYSQSVIGVQMACAYAGMMISPIVFGRIAQNISILYLPHCAVILVILTLVFTELLNAAVAKNTGK